MLFVLRLAEEDARLNQRKLHEFAALRTTAMIEFFVHRTPLPVDATQNPKLSVRFYI